MADLGKKLDDTCAAFVKQSSTCMPCNPNGQEVVEEFSYKRSVPEAPKDGISFDDFKQRKKAKRARRKKGRAVAKEEPSKAPAGPYEPACWLCRMSGAAKDGTSTGLGRFFRMFTDNYRNCQEDELYIQLHRMFELEVKKPLEDQGIEVPDYDVEDIRLHFIEHAFDPTIFVSEEIKFLKEVCCTMKDHIFEDDKETKRTDVSDKRVWNYMKVQKQIVDLYHIKLQNMNFYDINTAVYRG